MSQNSDVTRTLAIDAQSLEQLKLQAKRDPAKSIAAVSKQFEVLFLNTMLKNMREAVPQDGMFDNEQTRLYTSMLDQQLAQHVATRGIGLAETMARQLTRSVGIAPESEGATASDAVTAGTLAAPEYDDVGLPFGPLPTPVRAPQDVVNRDVKLLPRGPKAVPLPTVVPQPAVIPAAERAAPTDTVQPLPLSKTRDFVNRIWQHAVDAARATGIKPQFMVGQAALESGWGRRELRDAKGAPTHNLFNIKAGAGWNGPVVEKLTTEYVNGVEQKVMAKFRAYTSYAEGFSDYVNMLRTNSRYSNVLGNAQGAAGFAHGLQKAGYATDPAYAAKLVRVINGQTLRQSLAGEPSIPGAA